MTSFGTPRRATVPSLLPVGASVAQGVERCQGRPVGRRSAVRRHRRFTGDGAAAPGFGADEGVEFGLDVMIAGLETWDRGRS